MATQTGFFPVFEAENGEVTSVRTIRRPAPVTEYLRLQGRFAHLFDEAGNPAQPDVLDVLQAMADDNIRRYELLGETDEVLT